METREYLPSFSVYSVYSVVKKICGQTRPPWFPFASINVLRSFARIGVELGNGLSLHSAVCFQPKSTGSSFGMC